MAKQWSSAQPDEIRVYFSTKNGSKLSVNIDRNLSVRVLQERILQTLQNHNLLSEGVSNEGNPQLSLGGEILEPNRQISSYALENDTVVHPRWGSLRASHDLNDSLTWLDPDWYEEFRRRSSRAAAGFLDRLCAAPAPTIGRLFWPGPLVANDVRAQPRRPTQTASKPASRDEGTAASAPAVSSRHGDLLML